MEKIDLQAIAGSLGVTTVFLQDRLMRLGLAQVMNEADRLAHAEEFDKPDPKTLASLYPPHTYGTLLRRPKT
ncbi:hypothetical protein QCF19_14365, partial [Staphylococcus aureus]|nr:hypothetical protein [Staphylococcus aureus]